MPSILDLLTWFAPNGPLTYHDVNVLSIAFIVLFVTIGLALISAGVSIFGFILNMIAKKTGKEKSLGCVLCGYSIFSGVLFVIWTFLVGILINFFLVAPTYGSSWIGVVFTPVFWTICLLILFRDEKFHMDHAKEEEKPRLEEVVINNIFNSLWVGVKNRPYPFLVLFIGIFIFSLVFNVTFCNLCISYYPHELSTSFSRKVLGVGKVCEYNKICFDYLTVPEDLQTQMIVNFQYVGNEPVVANVTYWSDSMSVRLNVSAKCFDVKNPDEDRWHCWADLTGLSPDTTYNFFTSVVYADVVRTPVEKFRTAGNTNVTFIAGGDLSWSASGIALSKYAAQQDPVFALVAGDVAYDNGGWNCYLRWDQWFQSWKTYMTTSSGYTIPILTAIGNHEAGGFKKSRYWDSYYLKYFPHQTNITHVDPNERLTYHKHRINADSMMVILDTWAHETPLNQVGWLKTTLSESLTYRNRFVGYHSAVYPFIVVASEAENEEIVDHLGKYWQPVFDQYGVTAAFENHFHGYKKTKPIKNGIEVAGGTVYLGDGDWGVPPNLESERNPSLLMDKVLGLA